MLKKLSNRGYRGNECVNSYCSCKECRHRTAVLSFFRDKMLLDDLVQLQMGENVLVIVDSSEELDGFLRYKGPVSSLEPAYIFGVELVNHPGHKQRQITRIAV